MEKKNLTLTVLTVCQLVANVWIQDVTVLQSYSAYKINVLDLTSNQPQYAVYIAQCTRRNKISY